MSENQPPNEGSDQQSNQPIPPQPTEEQSSQPDSNRDIDSNEVMRGVAERITNAAGVAQLEGFSLKDMFSEVFKKHSENEVEEYFTVGTTLTTPPIEAVDSSWPKPWVFFKTFVGAVAVYIGFVIAWREFQNSNLLPGLIIVGAFAIPFSTLIFFFEANVRKNVSLYQVIRLLFLGGILSLIFSLILFQVSFTLSLNWLGASVAGIVEEPGKLLALMLVVNNPRYKYTLNGLLFGAAVGTGFAAFESAGYALQAGFLSLDPDAILNSILLRGILAPFTHIVWTGMSAAVLWKIKGKKKFQFSMVQDPRFIRVFSISVVLHMLWNSPIEIPFLGKQIALGFVAWVVILALIQDGLKQLRHEKLAVISVHEAEGS